MFLNQCSNEPLGFGEPESAAVVPQRASRIDVVLPLWCEACAYTGRYTDAFYREQRLDRVLDSLHLRSYSVGFYYSFLA